MRIKISASIKEEFPTSGPYKTLDIVERESQYEVGDMTHYGEVILILPSIMLRNDDVEQSVVVKLDPTSLGIWCEESVREKPPSSYDRIEFSPIAVNRVGRSDDPPLTGPYTIFVFRKPDD